MEQWERLLRDSSSSEDQRFYSKVLQTTEIVFKEDLAGFEIEWIVETLLDKPISLLETISTNRTNETWYKTIGDAFKVLSDITTKHWIFIQSYYEDIMKLCLLSYDPQTRKHAIQCIISMIKHAAVLYGEVTRHINALSEATTCKAPLAQLVATICEYHDEQVTDEYQRIWRIYINMLQSNKNTVTVISAALQGILSLFNKFGEHLPIAEMNDFYTAMTKEYLQMPRCEAVIFTILKRHANLFKERLADDKALRSFIWEAISQKIDKIGAQALRSIYETIFPITDKNKIESLLTLEILPRSESNRALVKYTALRVITYAQVRYSAGAALTNNADSLEFELRNANVSYEVAEAVSWCIESNMKNSERLLQAALLFYDHFPPATRRDVVVNNTLHATDHVRKAAVIFLIKQSIQDTSSIDKYLPLWTDLLQSPQDAMVDNTGLVFEDALNYLLDQFIEINEEKEEVSSAVEPLLKLTAHMITLYTGSAQQSCSVLLPLLVQLQARGVAHAALLSAIAASVTHMQDCDLTCLNEIINIESCTDEVSLCEMLKLAISVPEGVSDNYNLLKAMQIIFTRNDVEAALLSKALNKFENLLITQRHCLDDKLIPDIINKIQKLASRKNMTGKDARVLHRDVIMFLGKYGNNNNKEYCNEDNISIVKMKDLLVFCLPSAADGMKINIQRLVQLAIECEDAKALESLLAVIASNWDATLSRATKDDIATAQRVVVRLAHALCRTVSHGIARDRTPHVVQQAILMCDSVPAVQDILTCISEESSAGARRMLADSLEELLGKDQPASITSELVTAVCERAAVMINSQHATTIRAGLDITATLITALNGINDLTQNYLPNVLIDLSGIHSKQALTTFQTAADTFVENSGLFSTEKKRILVKDLIQINLSTEIKDINAYKETVTANLVFVKDIFDFDEFLQILLTEFRGNVNSFVMLACGRSVFDYDMNVCRKILGYHESKILNSLFGLHVNDDLVDWDTVFMFMKEYSVILLELQYEKTLKFIADLIKNIKPYTVVQLHRTISACLSTFKSNLNKIPTVISSAYHEWCKKLEINNINVKNVIHAPAQEIPIRALKIFVTIFGSTELYETKKWTAALLDMYKTKRLRGFQLKMSIISDMLSVSVGLLTSSDIKLMLLNNRHGLEFCKIFINVYFERLIAKPYVLLEAEENSCSLLLDIVECCMKRKCPVDVCGNIVELIDELWARYDEKTTFNEKQSLLKHLSRFPNGVEAHSKPTQWAVRILTNKDTDKHEKIRLIGLLPARGEYSCCYLSYTACLPTRLSEMRGDHSAMLRGLLDALAAQGGTTLFNTVITLAAGDDTQGWWDEAMDSCMSALALKADDAMLKAAYDKCWEGMSLGVCNRILVPLLRYSSPKFCEEFFSSVISDLFAKLRHGHREPTPSDTYHKCVVAHIKTLTVLQIVFEKVPASSLESANSMLHRSMGVQKPWASTSETCRLCVTIRDKVFCPVDASDAIRESCRLLQCAAYNCLTAAICRRRPQERFYSCVFDVHTWANIVDKDYTYSLPLQPLWRHRSTQRHSVSVESSATSSGEGTMSLTAGTLRTRLYLRTLSENPLHYDMIQDDEDDQPMVNQELQLVESELNSHECSATLTALLDHSSALEYSQWRDTLSSALVGNLPKNAKWLLAQAICNTGEQLKPFSGVFRSALFQLIAETANVTEDRIQLNGLHLDLINLLTNWDENPEISDKKYLNATVDYLISTCIWNRHSYSIYRSLLDALDRLLKVYVSMVSVSWTVFEQYFKDKPTDASYYLQILQRLLKHKIHIPELVPTLLASFDPKLWRPTPRLAEVFGQALTACPDYQKEDYLHKFRGVLDKIRANNAGDYVKVLYSSQKWCKNICDERHFKIISDLAPKIEKPKCLSILSSNIEQFSSDRRLITDMLDTIDVCELISTDHCDPGLRVASAAMCGMDDVLKRRVVMLVAKHCDTAARDVFDKAFQDLLSLEDEPPSKKCKTELTPILSLIESDDAYVRCVMEGLIRCILDRKVSKLVEKLHGQLNIRFAECFCITIYQPTVTNHKVDLSVCVSALLDVLFQKIQLPEEVREVSIRKAESSKVVLLSSTYQGTFRSSSGTDRYKVTKIKDTRPMDIDVRMPIAEILDTLLDFCKVNPEASTTICIEIMKHLRCESRGFDLDAVVSKQLAYMLTKNPNNLTPFVIETCRVFIDSVAKINGFKESVETLKRYTRGTEGQGITTLLYEDLMLRCGGDAMFELGIEKEETYDVTMDGVVFSLEDLIAAFGKLSNWDDLRIQDKRRLERDLPVLWTDADDFILRLDEYITSIDTNDALWFDKMATCYSEGGRQSSMRWLREIDQWPKRHFVASAVCEAVSWQHSGGIDTALAVTDIAAADCRAEWAARLMIRTACLSQRIPADDSQNSVAGSLCRAQELEWCAAANRSGLPQAALHCINRNKSGLRDNETLSWLQQKVLALRTIGINQRDDGVLKKALDTAEKYTSMFSEYSSPEVFVGMEKLILQLNFDLKTLPKSKLDGVMQEVAKHNREYEGWMVSYNNAQVLKSLYDISLLYYDELDSTKKDGSTDNVISSMSDTIGCQIEYNLTTNYNVLFSVILNKLESYDRELSDATAKSLLDKLQSTIDNLDEFTIEHLHKLSHKFPASVLEKYPTLKSAGDSSTDICKQYLSLVADPAYTILNYMEQLDRALKANDEIAWRTTFDTMKANVFENPYAGTDYTKYKNKLYDLCVYRNSVQTSKTLRDIIKELSKKRPQSTILLSQLCPALRCRDTLVRYSSGLCKLLAIPPNVTLVKFYQEVSVFTDSIRRPCVSRALLSNGRTMRYLHKRGEPLALDAALQRCAALLPDLCDRAAFRGYSVTPLSTECGMMEYLEDHERLRALILTAHKIDETVTRPGDDQLILSPPQSLQSYRQMCAKIPRHVLRSAIELHSTCAQDFIAKKQTFMETLSSMTIISWIFGVGDRHMENMMYSMRDGGVCGVDWAALLQYGTCELPPARLTATLLAVCDVTILESRLQTLLMSIKENHKMFLSYVKQSFKWMGDDFDNKFAYIKELVESKTLCYQVTIDALQKSKKVNKEKYIQLLEDVFEKYQQKETYNVEEQISCLLQQCTDARILSVTRRGLQPWL